MITEHNITEYNSVEEKLVAELIKRKLTITTAESCTGGMISSSIVNVAGASWVLNEAYITYANNAKIRLLGVKAETIEKYGVVSEETVREMAEGAAKAAKADCAIAVSGVAGPDGGTKNKPVGTVCAGFFYKGKVISKKYNFKGNRFEVRNSTTIATLTDMLEIIKNS